MNNTLTTELVAELRRLMAEAQPPQLDCTNTEQCDRHLIAAAVNALPALLDAAEREAKMRAVVEEMLSLRTIGHGPAGWDDRARAVLAQVNT
jgi:hypothetical protein